MTDDSTRSPWAGRGRRRKPAAPPRPTQAAPRPTQDDPRPGEAGRGSPEVGAGPPGVDPRSRRPASREQIARRRVVALGAGGLIVLLFVLVVMRGSGGCGDEGPPAAGTDSSPPPAATSPPVVVSPDGDGVKMATFLGGPARRFYGLGPVPRRLDVVWKLRIGGGWTSGKSVGDKAMYWSGTGWTGQPCLVRDGGRDYLLIGGYDHKLRKIDAVDGRVVWSYGFDDVIKGSPSVFANPQPSGEDDRYIVLDGSRRGYPLKPNDPEIAPYRAIAFGDGKELWRLPVPGTASYSRDCDGSGFWLDGRLYAGVESGWFYAIDPIHTQPWGSDRSPAILERRLLLGDEADRRKHGDDLVLEASPALLGDTVFVASGAGHVYGLARSDLRIVFDYRTGSDLDGTTVITRDGKVLVAVEKQYIRGQGGVLALDPDKPVSERVAWYFPTGDRRLSEWLGGIVGSVAVDDEYVTDGRPALAAFNAIDGYVYLIAREALAKGTVRGPNGERGLRTPRLIWRDWVGGSISTPVLVDDALITAGVDNKVHVYRIDARPAAEASPDTFPGRDGKPWRITVLETATFTAGSSFESTPLVWRGRIYIGSRDGWFYCLGER